MKRPLGKKMHRGVKILVIWVALLMLVFFAFYRINHDLKPVMMAMCDGQARIIATETISGTIRDEFGSKISYDDLVNIKTDKDGNVVMIQANTVELNRIGSQMALSVQKRIQGIGGRGVKIPIGVLLKNDLFAYYGPKLTFKMQPMGSVLTSYRSEFQSAGINQTRHVIYFDVTADILVVIPLARNDIKITTSIPIAESIIVGKVPGTYGNFQSIPGENNTRIDYNTPKN